MGEPNFSRLWTLSVQWISSRNPLPAALTTTYQMRAGANTIEKQVKFGRKHKSESTRSAHRAQTARTRTSFVDIRSPEP